jgi:hypothetical protein
LAFGEEEFITVLAMTHSEAVSNNLSVDQQPDYDFSGKSAASG